jgi:hypothetical protein
VVVVGIHFWEVVWHDFAHHIGDNRVILPGTVFTGKEAHHLEPVTTCPAHQLCWRRGLRRDDGDDTCMVVHWQMKGQGLQYMLVLGKPLRAWRMEILPGFELVDDHDESMKAMILRQLAIDVGEATADVLGNVISM